MKGKSANHIVCLLAILAGWICSARAWAALSVISGNFEQGNPPTGLKISSTVASGQVIVVFATYGVSSGWTVSDNVNSGNYTLLANYSSPDMAIYWKVTNASGEPSISISGTMGYSYASSLAITGFVGTPTLDTAIINTATGTSASEAINATSNANNEVLLIAQVNSSVFVANLTVTGWNSATTGSSNLAQAGWYAIEPSAGTQNNFSAALGSSYTWYVQLAGIYDPSSSGTVPPGFFLSQRLLRLDCERWADACLPGRYSFNDKAARILRRDRIFAARSCATNILSQKARSGKGLSCLTQYHRSILTRLDAMLNSSIARSSPAYR